MDLPFSTIAELAPRLESGQLSPVELTRAVLDQIERLEGRLNCYITLTPEIALEQARAAEAEIRRGRYRGPLHGIPLAIKDNLETVGIRTTGAAKVLADYVPAEDAPTVARVKEAGAVILGKTNLHELGKGATTVNPHHGPTRNPWHPDRIAGGSSGGSAAAVSAGLATAALGTDAGGSVRIPAALCGVVGLKPTQGRVPIRGCVGASNPTVDHVGPLARSVADAALLLQAIAGPDLRDPTTVDAPALAADLGASRPIAGLRVGVPVDHYFADLDPDVERVVRAAIDRLAELGATLVEVALPNHAALLDGMSGLMADQIAYYATWLRTRLRDFGRDVQASLLTAQFIPGGDYAIGLRARRLFADLYARAMADVDLLATPTVIVPAYPIEDADEPFALGVPRQNPPLARNTRPANLTGRPAISLPAGFTRDALPVGLQLIGQPFDESTLLGAAAAFEAATEWQNQRPPLIGDD
jgi:aspartyl-tRNA(Asn)/glutamyl-tRNA(Gln) amidotransferase subunit A